MKTLLGPKGDIRQEQVHRLYLPVEVYGWIRLFCLSSGEYRQGENGG